MKDSKQVCIWLSLAWLHCTGHFFSRAIIPTVVFVLAARSHIMIATWCVISQRLECLWLTLSGKSRWFFSCSTMAVIATPCADNLYSDRLAQVAFEGKLFPARLQPLTNIENLLLVWVASRRCCARISQRSNRQTDQNEEFVCSADNNLQVDCCSWSFL